MFLKVLVTKLALNQESLRRQRLFFGVTEGNKIGIGGFIFAFINILFGNPENLAAFEHLNCYSTKASWLHGGE